MVIVIVNISGRGGKAGAVEKCGACRGSGMQVRIQQLGPGFVQQIQSVCSECQGQGERINSKDRCKECAGRKIVREKKILEVHIDKGNFSCFSNLTIKLICLRHLFGTPNLS